MHRIRSVMVKEVNRFLKLCTSDDGIVNKQQILILNQLMNRNLLHFRNTVALSLSSRREAS